MAGLLRRAMVAALLGIVVWVMAGSVARSQEPDRKSLWGKPHADPDAVSGLRNCFMCHAKTDLGADLPLPPYITGVNDDGWVLLNELLTWTNEDKHYQAYTVLLGERSQNMARLLGVLNEAGESVIHQDARCLACHSAVPIADLEKSGNLVTADTLNDPRFNLGVSCEGCHGPSGSGESGTTSWEDAHWKNKNWRFMDPHQKFNEFGFWDVRTITTQSEICLSCHLGNVEQGKVITHEIYAAGHPPLPSFELSAFVAQQPQHWRDFQKKADEIKAEFQEKAAVPEIDDGFAITRIALVSALMNVSQSMQLNADLIDAETESPLDKPAWPELANYACFACHHDLERDGWRQRRPSSHPPGRPVLHEWPLALASAAVQMVDKQDEFARLVADVENAVVAQPFGRTDDLQEAARALQVKTREWADELETKEFDADTATRALEAICQLGSERLLDYDSARQLIWAAEQLIEELLSRENARSPEDKMSVEEARTQRPPRPWNGWLQGEQLNRPQEILKQLESAMILDLREGRKRTQAVPTDQRERPLTEVELDKTLPKIAEYNPRVVQEAFSELLDFLTEE